MTVAITVILLMYLSFSSQNLGLLLLLWTDCLWSDVTIVSVYVEQAQVDDKCLEVGKKARRSHENDHKASEILIDVIHVSCKSDSSAAKLANGSPSTKDHRHLFAR